MPNHAMRSAHDAVSPRRVAEQNDGVATDTHVRVTLSRGALRENVEEIQRRLGSRTLFPVVKSDAYGHGLREIVRMLEGTHVPYLAVFSVSEAETVARLTTSSQPLILGPIGVDDVEAVRASRAAVAISDGATARRLGSSSQNSVIPVHLFIDSGMSREGILPDDLKDVIALIRTLPGIAVEGVLSHFHSEGEASMMKQQERIFSACLKRIPSSWQRWIHMGSSGCLKTGTFPGNAARVGIALYGSAPSAGPWEVPLRPVLTMTARVESVKTIPRGTCVSYGCTFRAPSTMRVGIVPVGYGAGIPLSLSGTGGAWVHGCRVPIIGRVCMGHIILDLSSVPHVNPGEWVELLGPHMRAEDVATSAGTIPYELFTRVSSAIPRSVVV